MSLAAAVLDKVECPCRVTAPGNGTIPDAYDIGNLIEN
jgi:hypothetical protein